jgi:transcriptional regulator with XRE-family HTH domain
MAERKKVRDLHKKWLRERPGYAKAVADLEPEFRLAREMISARAEAGLTQEQLAARMKTTRTVIARLESGRAMPSTRTLERIAVATGHELRISFVPTAKRPATRSGARRASA